MNRVPVATAVYRKRIRIILHCLPASYGAAPRPPKGFSVIHVQRPSLSSRVYIVQTNLHRTNNWLDLLAHFWFIVGTECLFFLARVFSQNP